MYKQILEARVMVKHAALRTTGRQINLTPGTGAAFRAATHLAVA